jgi:hypothetical protein
MASRMAALAALFCLAACTLPSGVAVDECNTSWRGLDARIVTTPRDDGQEIPIACMRRVDDRRISVGFEMPPGPDCYELSAIELVESADAVAVTLRVARTEDAGACPDEPLRAVTEVDLQAPVGDRSLLDGSR